jgi:hypothetical protein
LGGANQHVFHIQFLPIYYRNENSFIDVIMDCLNIQQFSKLQDRKTGEFKTKFFEELYMEWNRQKIGIQNRSSEFAYADNTKTVIAYEHASSEEA